MQQAFVGALVLEPDFTALGEDRGDFSDAQFRGFLDRPVHALAPGQALAEMDLQRRLDLPGEAFIDLHHHALFADFDQCGAKLLARTVEQLQRIALGHAQHAADVVGLGFGQLVLADAQGGVDEEAGQSHAGSLKKGVGHGTVGTSVGASLLAMTI
ncbi:hypothetical protein D3C86_1211280 [compost metagenome]